MDCAHSLQQGPVPANPGLDLTSFVLLLLLCLLRCCCCCCHQLEDTCAPIVSKLYAAGGDAAGGDNDSGDDEDLGDHDEL